MQNNIFRDLWRICEEKHYPLFIMEKMNAADTINKIREWKPELIVVVGWYHLIGKQILEIPSKGVIGLHSSLLPKYRGGAPLVWQMINGEDIAGITLFYMDQGVDSGDIVAQKSVRIENNDTIGTLYEKVGEAGIELLVEYIPLIAADCAPRIKQIGLTEQDIFPMRRPEDGRIDWTKTSKQIFDFVRAQTKPYPGAFTYYMSHKLIIWSCEIVARTSAEGNFGEILDFEYEGSESRPIISTGDLKQAIKIMDYEIRDESDYEVKMGQSDLKIGRCMEEGNESCSTGQNKNAL
jgi:methionyl-tRNA formyltransferase